MRPMTSLRFSVTTRERVGTSDAEGRLPAAEPGFHLTLYGPGYGESLVAHIGEDRWMIVDSCVHPRSGIPLALLFFELTGRDPRICVERIVATHWHDDHIRGISQIYETCPRATFVCSDVLSRREVLALFTAKASPTPPPERRVRSARAEMTEVFRIARRRKQDGIITKPLQWASSDKTLWTRNSDGLSVRVTALSPSDASITAAAELLGKDLSAGSDISRLPPASNEPCVALWLQVDDVGALLGADLEVTRDPARGWDAVLNLLEAPPQGLGALIKVPHHGSASAHHDDVWIKMLQPKPFALVAPWQTGGRTLPTDDDLDRLRAVAGVLYVSHMPHQKDDVWNPPGFGPNWISGDVDAVGNITLLKKQDGEWSEQVVPPATAVFRSAQPSV